MDSGTAPLLRKASLRLAGHDAERRELAADGKAVAGVAPVTSATRPSRNLAIRNYVNRGLVRWEPACYAALRADTRADGRFSEINW